MTYIDEEEEPKVPRNGDHVWTPFYANGIITYFHWEDGEKVAHVYFYNSKATEEIDVAVFEGCWTDKFGGFWILE